MRAEFERKEVAWFEVEQRYAAKIQELQGRLAAEAGPVQVVTAATEEAQRCSVVVTDDPRRQLDRDRRGRGGKSLRALQTLEGKVIEGAGQEGVAPQGHDENAAPLVNNSTRVGVEQHDVVAAKKLHRGKQLDRVAVVRAFGGRKGLSEQLRRVRRLGEKAKNADVE